MRYVRPQALKHMLHSPGIDSVAALYASGAGGSQRTCLVLLTGLPGAGKSALCRAVVALSERTRAFLGPLVSSLPRVRHVEFDAIDAPDFASVRLRAREIVCGLLEEERQIILVDDNQFYASMRKEYRRMAASREAIYIQIYIQADLDLCLIRNELRSSKARLDAGIISRMHKRFDDPQNEKDTVTLDAHHPAEYNAALLLDHAIKAVNVAPLRNPPCGNGAKEPLNPKQLEDLSRKERIRQTVLKAKAEGVSGEQLNQIAKGIIPSI